MNVIKKLLISILSSGAGLLSGWIVVTAVIAWIYYHAQDGPIFPAPLVAVVVVAPISFILFTFQGIVMIYELSVKRDVTNALPWIGMLGGLVAGLTPYFIAISIAPYRSNPYSSSLLAFSGLGIGQGLIVFGCQWFVTLVVKFITGGSFVKSINKRGVEKR